MKIEKILKIIIVALACPICIPLILEDDYPREMAEELESDE